MTVHGNKNRSRGFSISELLISMSIFGVIGTAVFSGMGQMLLITSQEEIAQRLRNDLLLSLSQVRRDIQMSTRVVEEFGPHSSGSASIVLRQPVFDETGELEEDEYQYVVYYVNETDGDEKGLTREVWDSDDEDDPDSTSIIDSGRNVLAIGFRYNGEEIDEVDDLDSVVEVEVILVSGSETGLVSEGSFAFYGQSGSQLDMVQDMTEWGIDFTSLRGFIDETNYNDSTVVLTSSVGAATLRNHNYLGK